MLGTLQVLRGEHIVTESDWHTRQARQLLKILATERPRPVSTDRLIEILWPDSTPQAAATTLRSAINSLRNVLEPDRPNRAPSQYILTQMPGYAFHSHPDIWLDVDQFETLLNSAPALDNTQERRKTLTTAIELYRDDYLISDPYADWAENERDRLRERFFGALLQVAELYAQTGDYVQAIAACRRILAQDEVRENAYQALMRYLAESGDSAAALLAYEKCREILADELGADPSPLTQKLHERILNGEVQPRTTQVLEENRETKKPSDKVRGTGAEDKSLLAFPARQELPQLTFMPGMDATFLDIFVGRDSEMAVMEKSLRQALAGKGNLLLLDGEAGVGKTRLAYYVLQQAASAGATVISAACQALERQLPFAPLAEAIGRYIHNLPTPALQSLPANSLSQLAQIVPSLQDLIPSLPALSTSSSEVFTLASESRQRLIDGVIAFLTALANLRPLVIFLDDLHWADTDTLAVIGRLAQRVNDVPILLLLAYRSDELAENEALGTLLHALQRTQSQQKLSVRRLTQPQVQQYVARLLGAQSNSAEPLADVLFETTRGNALFVTEALRDLQERKIGASGMPDRLPEQSASHHWGDEPWLLSTLRRNQRVQEIIEERISRLPESAYSVLQVSAVIGRDFSLELLEQSFISDPLEGLEVLLQRNFLIERPDQRLDFSHQVVRQASYDGMSNLQRRRWHLRVADALVKLRRDERNPNEVAMHYSLAGDSARPQYARYSVQAGEWLLRSFGFRQALLAFDHALEVLESLPDSPPEWIERALQGRGLAYESLFDPDGMSNAYRRLQQWASAQGDRKLLLTTYSRLTSMLALFGQQRESNLLLQELVTALSQGDSTGVHSQVITDLLQRRLLIYSHDKAEKDGVWAAYTPPPAAVSEPVEDLLRTFEPVHAVLPIFDYGWTLLVQGQLGEATYCLQKAVDLANETSQPSIASTGYHQLAVTARILGDLEQSQALNERSVAINRTVPGAASELASMWPRIGSALISLDSGRIDEAERRLRRVLDFLGERKSYATYRNSAHIGLGLVLLARGERGEAKALLHEAMGDSDNLYPYTHVRGLIGLARIARQEGNPGQAADCLRRALFFAGRRSLLEEYVSALLAIAQMQPQGAPVDELVQAMLSYVRSIGLESAERVLAAASAGL